MASDVIRCSDCNAVFRAVPSWLATAKVNFTCTSCPKRASRSGVRFEPAVEPRPALDLKVDDAIQVVDLDDMDDVEDLDLGDEDLDSLGDEKDL